jgi:hypothetical protein
MFIEKFARSHSPEEFNRIDAFDISEKDTKKRLPGSTLEQRERFKELYLRVSFQKSVLVRI